MGITIISFSTSYNLIGISSPCPRTLNLFPFLLETIMLPVPTKNIFSKLLSCRAMDKWVGQGFIQAATAKKSVACLSLLAIFIFNHNNFNLTSAFSWHLWIWQNRILTNSILSPSLLCPEVKLLLMIHLVAKLKLKRAKDQYYCTEGNNTPELSNCSQVKYRNHVFLYDISSELWIALYLDKTLSEKTNTRKVRSTSYIIL